MSEIDPRFAGLKKLLPLTAAALMARDKIALQTGAVAEGEESVPALLSRLEGKMAEIDRLRLMAHALPAREATWLACLAARDLLGEIPADRTPAPLAAAEAWVFKPTEENREHARAVGETAAASDPTAQCTVPVLFCDGRLGADEKMQKFEAPSAAGPLCVFALVVKAVTKDPATAEACATRLLDRALDIARGGSGRLA
ncbi:MAG: hypothetical protein AAFR52_04485 [Pseudomonadota bacterium]